MSIFKSFVFYLHYKIPLPRFELQRHGWKKEKSEARDL